MANAKGEEVLYIRLPASLKQIIADEAKRRKCPQNTLVLDLLEKPLAAILAQHDATGADPQPGGLDPRNPAVDARRDGWVNPDYDRQNLEEP